MTSKGSVTTMQSLDFSNEPRDRSKTLLIHQSEPFNAEPGDLTEFINHHVTPINLVYGRNHGPIPDIQEANYTLTVNGLVDHELKLTLSDIKSLPKTTVVTALQVPPLTSIALTSVRRKQTRINVQDPRNRRNPLVQWHHIKLHLHRRPSLPPPPQSRSPTS